MAHSTDKARTDHDTEEPIRVLEEPFSGTRLPSTMPEGSEPARILGNKASMEGYVWKEHFYVLDVISNGVSEAQLLARPPRYHPIPLSHIRHHQQNLVLLENASGASTNPGVGGV